MNDDMCPECGLVNPRHCKSPDEAEDCKFAPVEGRGPVIRTGPLAGLRRQHYGAIYADPPWSFLTRSDKGKDRGPEQHYNTMTLDEIKALPVAELAAPDCALFMWTIDTHLPMALDVLKAWGFTYKTRAFCWTKLNKLHHTLAGEDSLPMSDRPWFKGMGFWTRANPEDCLLAVRGAPKRQSKAERRLIVSPLREHSRKPDEAMERIERLVNGPYCELFSRSTRPGWSHMGNEVGKFDELDPVEADDIADLV